MYKIRIFDISLTKSGFVLFLSDNEDGPVLPIIIGISEAQSITMALNGIEPDRPLSHDLCKTVLDNFQASIIKVIVKEFNDGIFKADLYLKTNDGVVILDSRPSDAVALAIRADAPIYVADEIMLTHSILHPIDNDQDFTQIDHTELNSKPISEVSIIEHRLQDAIDREKYEEAAILRDKLKNLKRDN